MNQIFHSKLSGSTLTATQTKADLFNGDSIFVEGLTGAEVAALKVSIAGSFVTVTDSAGVAIQMTATKKSVSIAGAGTYGVDIDTTTGPVSVVIVQSQK